MTLRTAAEAITLREELDRRSSDFELLVFDTVLFP